MPCEKLLDLKKSFVHKQGESVSLDRERDSSVDEFDLLLNETESLEISDYELLVSFAIILWNKLKGKRNIDFEGVFCIDKRGRIESAPSNYFGNACAFPNFDIKYCEQDLFSDAYENVLHQVKEAYESCVAKKEALDSLEVAYEKLFSSSNPLKAQSCQNLHFDFTHQLPLLQFLRRNVPLFLGATDFQTEVLDFQFSNQKCSSIDFLTEDFKLSSNVIRFLRHSEDYFKITIVADMNMKKNLDNIEGIPYLSIL